jgi:predicted dehydrogenase
MATNKIRLGVIGANIHRGWAPRSHLPALAASPEFELMGVCTTRMESAQESAQLFNAKLAFDNYQDMINHPDIDAVAVVLKVPSHYEPTMAALNAGKHVYTEWPLGQDTEQAQEMSDLARARGVVNMVGLQARNSPALLHARELISSGYIGNIMSCKVSMIRGGILQRVFDRTWQRDITLGANTLTIAFGHTVDAMRFVVGDFSNVSGVVSTQAKKWTASDTGQVLDVTSPDSVMINGQLANGGVASVHVATTPYAGEGLQMEIYGEKGTIVAKSKDSPQLSEVTLQGSQGSDQLDDIVIPSHHINVLESMPKGEPFNVGQMYYKFGEAIRGSSKSEPNFEIAVELHRFLDNIRESNKTGARVVVGG